MSINKPHVAFILALLRKMSKPKKPLKNKTTLITCAIRNDPRYKLSSLNPSIKKRPAEYHIKYKHTIEPYGSRLLLRLNITNKTKPAKFHADSYKKVGWKYASSSYPCGRFSSGIKSFHDSEEGAPKASLLKKFPHRPMP